MTRPPTNIGASVRARLLRVATERGEDFQRVLTRYASERLLYRLSRSQHADRFVLKGATLFTIWTHEPHRATGDVDLLGFGEPTSSAVGRLFEDIMAVDVGDDGVTFDTATMRAASIREDRVYGGIRVTVHARVTSAMARVQFDIGFGDVVTPAAATVTVPVLLDMPAPQLRAYPRETVVAEKAEALVKLGLANSRMKDFYDLQVLASQFDFEGDLLARALRATFERRGSDLPAGLPPGLTPAFFDDRDKQRQWAAFIRKTGARNAGSLPDACSAVVRFLMPAVEAAERRQPWGGYWPAGGPWST